MMSDPKQEIKVNPKVQAALDKLQAAQTAAADAAEEICSEVGYADRWSEIIDLHGQIKALWNQLYEHDPKNPS